MLCHLEVAGSKLEDVSPEMAAHLEACPPCADMHATLLEVARLEASGSLTGTEALWAEVAALVSKREARRHGARRGGLQRMPALLLAVGAAAAILLVAFGWQRAEERARIAGEASATAETNLLAMQERIEDLAARLEDAESVAAEAQSVAARNSEALALIHQLERDRTIRRDDGSWTRFYFSPGVSSAVVSVGALPELEDGEYFECWLKRAVDGTMLSAGRMAPSESTSQEHWMIEADKPLDQFSMFMITIEPQHLPLFEIPLTQDG